MYDHALNWLDTVKKRPNAYKPLRLTCMKIYCFFHILLVLLCIIVCFVCFYLILYIMYSYYYVYVFLLLCMFRYRYCVSFCCSMYYLYVNVYCTTATGCQPNCNYQIYIISYRIISYIISYHITSYHIISYISYHIS
jgi:hypothetical protein